jgi:hypothetical protein
MKKKILAKPAATEDASSHGKGSILRAWGRLESLYRRLPKLPFIDKDTSAILIISVLLYALFMAGVYLTTPHDQLHAILTEGKLSKNMQLALLPGEQYSYDISAAGKTERLQYDVQPSSICDIMVVESASQGQGAHVCLNHQGNQWDDPYQLNFSLGNQSMLLFSPWMLAASDDFSWQVDTVFSTGSAEISMPVNFKSLGTKKIAGRGAYEISLSSEIAPSSTYYIDSEKRVLLFADFGNVSARLVSAPFPLNWSNGVPN